MDDYPQHKAFGRKDEESVTKSPPRAHHDYFAVRPPLQHKILSIIYNYHQSESLPLHTVGISPFLSYSSSTLGNSSFYTVSCLFSKSVVCFQVRC